MVSVIVMSSTIPAVRVTVSKLNGSVASVIENVVPLPAMSALAVTLFPDHEE